MSDESMKHFLNIMNGSQINEEDIDNIFLDFDNENEEETLQIISDLKDAISSLESFYDPNQDESYQEGLYAGIQLSLNILSDIIDRYSTNN